MLLSLITSPVGFATTPVETNPCAGMKENGAIGTHVLYIDAADPTAMFANAACFDDNQDVTANPQAGADVTPGIYDMSTNLIDAASMPAVQVDFENGEYPMCAVNVHWHLGAEHRSTGQYDETGTGPADHTRRKLSGETETTRLGHQCHHYDDTMAKFTTEVRLALAKSPACLLLLALELAPPYHPAPPPPFLGWEAEPHTLWWQYEWEHCVDMKVGETYEVHWPHSAAGDCGTKWQHQTPFYDGVLCINAAIEMIVAGDIPMNKAVGVEAQVFTITNDVDSHADDLAIDLNGAVKMTGTWDDVAMYTGSTTGTSRDNEICSKYSPITWHVDRTCHMISAKKFDALCKMMQDNSATNGGDDMSDDLYAHGARETVLEVLTASNIGDNRA